MNSRTHDHVLNENKRVPIARVRELCGGVSEMSVHRWLREPTLNFPTPIYISQRRYWREADVIAWLDARQADAEQMRREANAMIAHADALEAEGMNQ